MLLDKLRSHVGLFLVVGFLFAAGGIGWEYLDTVWTVDALEGGTAAEGEELSSSARGVLLSFALVAVVLAGALAFFRSRKNKEEHPRD